MPISFSNQAHDDRREKHFRVTIDMSAYDTGTVGTSGGAVTPNGNFPTANKYPYITNLGTLATNVTRATSNALALNRERGLMRFESVVRQLSQNTNVDILDIEIVEANGSAQSDKLEFTVAVEDTDSFFTKDATSFTGIDGSTTVNTPAEVIHDRVAVGIACGSETYAADSTVSGSMTENRTVFRPATTDTVIESVTATPPTDLESIMASITVAQVTTTKRLSGEDS